MGDHPSDSGTEMLGAEREQTVNLQRFSSQFLPGANIGCVRIYTVSLNYCLHLNVCLLSTNNIVMFDF